VTPQLSQSAASFVLRIRAERSRARRGRAPGLNKAVPESRLPHQDSHPSLPQQHHRQIGESALSPAKFHVPSFASVMRPLWGWGQLREACNRYGLVTMCSVAFICKRHEAPVGMGSVLSSRAAPRSRCPPRAAPRSMQSVGIGDDERYAVAFARSMTSRKMAHRPLSVL